jgi:hypothetical protein
MLGAVHPRETFAAALELRTIGMDASWIARELVVPRRTVDHWLRRGRPGRVPNPPRPLAEEPFAYLLGLYLGDGHIARGGHGQHVLSIACDSAYPGIIEAASTARALVRGLIHSDGCRFVAAQRVGGKTYRYSRYSFSNRSDDIRGIFCAHLDLLGIGWTRPNAFQIAIDRRAGVAKLDAFVGPKR